MRLRDKGDNDDDYDGRSLDEIYARMKLSIQATNDVLHT